MNVVQGADELLSHHHYIAQLQLNSSGESSRGTNSPATSDFGQDFDGGVLPAGLPPSASHSLSQSPCEESSSRYRSASPDLAYQLQPLAEMEVIGACRRGRRRGRRNRTAAERESEVSQRRLSKNARERQRVENVKNEYARLQKLLGLSEQLENEPKERRRHCKLRTLTTAIERIRTLMAELQLRRAGLSDETPARADPAQHQGSSGNTATGQLNGSRDSVSSYWQRAQHPSSDGLSCNESSAPSGDGRDSNLHHLQSTALSHQPLGCSQPQNVPSVSPSFQSVSPFFSSYTSETPAVDTPYQPNTSYCFPTIPSAVHPSSMSHLPVTPLNPPPPFVPSPSDADQCYPYFSSPRDHTLDPVAAAWTQSLPPFSTFMPYDPCPMYTGEDGSFYPPPPPLPPPVPHAPATTSLQTFSY